MSFYEEHILPHVIHCACSSPPILKLRQRLVPQCTGKVLEVGVGSGINLDFYDKEKVDSIWALEPSEGMRKKAESKVNESPIDINWLDLPGEQIPLEDNSVDTVLLTYVLCTIPDYQTALSQIKRVLKPEGKVLFCEHGYAGLEKTVVWQNRINPYWKKLAGGCNVNRKIDVLITEAGFQIDKLDTFFIPKTPKFFGFTYLGQASLV